MYLPGDSSDSVYLLKHGRVKISKVNEDGKEFTLSILERGEIFGEVEAMESVPRQTLVQPLEDSLVCVIRREDFDRYLLRYSHVGARVMKLVGLRLRKIETRIGELVFKEAAARLAHLLLDLSETMGKPEENGIRVQARLTHENLASLIGTSKETVSTIMSRFVQHVMIKQDHRYIVIEDRARLSRMK